VTLEVFTAMMMITMMFIWVLAPVNAKTSEKHILSPSSALKIDIVNLSETSASTDESTRRQNSEEKQVLKYFYT
jgi:hypothetical protein